MNFLPPPSDSKKQFPCNWPTNRIEAFQAECKRQGHSVNKKLLELAEQFLANAHQEDGTHPTVELTIRELIGGVWVSKPRLIRDASPNPCKCVVCQNTATPIEQAAIDTPATGNRYWQFLPNDDHDYDTCVCLDCLVATAITATSFDMLMTELPNYYSINKLNLQNSPDGKRLNQKIQDYRHTYFMSLPQLEDASDEDILGCWQFGIDRGGDLGWQFADMQKMTDCNKIWNYANGQMDLPAQDAHTPSVRFWKEKYSGFAKSFLIAQGRELLGSPHLLSKPILFDKERKATFDAGPLALKKSTGLATLADIADAAQKASKPVQTVTMVPNALHHAPPAHVTTQAPTPIAREPEPPKLPVLWQHLDRGELCLSVENPDRWYWKRYPDDSPVATNYTGTSFWMRLDPDEGVFEVKPGNPYNPTITKYATKEEAHATDRIWTPVATVVPSATPFTPTAQPPKPIVPDAPKVERLWQCTCPYDDRATGDRVQRYRLKYSFENPRDGYWSEYNGAFEECTERVERQYLDRDWHPDHGEEFKQDHIETVVFEVGEMLPNNFGQLGESLGKRPEDQKFDKPIIAKNS